MKIPFSPYMASRKIIRASDSPFVLRPRIRMSDLISLIMGENKRNRACVRLAIPRARAVVFDGLSFISRLYTRLCTPLW